MINIGPPRELTLDGTPSPAVVIPPVEAPKSVPSATTAFHAMMNFQSTVLDSETEPGQITEALDFYQEQLMREGEENARSLAASQELREREDFITQTLGRVNPSAAADAILNMPYRDTYLEERSIDALVNNSLADEESLGPLDIVDTVAETEKKLAHVENELKKWVAKRDELSWLNRAADIAGSLLVWNNVRSSVGLTEDSSPNYLNPLKGSQIFDEVYELVFNNRTIEEFIPAFEKYMERLESRSGIFGVNEDLVIRGLERLLRFNNPGAISLTNAEGVLDYASVLGGGATIVRTPAAIARVTGNPQLAARLGATNPHNALTGVQQLPLTGEPNLAIASNVQQLQQAATKSINNHFDEISKYKNPTQLDQIINQTKDTMETFYPGRVIDVRFQRVDNTGEAQFTEFTDVYLGTQKGQGFSTEQWATNQAQYMGLTNFSVVQDLSTRRWLIKVEHRPTEGRNVLGLDMDDISASYVKNHLAGARQTVGDRLTSTAALAELRSGALVQHFDGLIKNIESLNKAQKKDFNVVAVKGLNTGGGKWFNDAELRAEYQLAFNRDPSPKEVTAYHSFRAISDIEWSIRNRALRESLAFDNWRELNYFGEPALSRLVDRVPNNAKVFDSQGNQVTPAPGDTIVQLMEPRSNPQGGFPIGFVKLDRTTDLRELPNEVLGRAEGGRRFYDVQYYLKQANNLVTADGVHVFHPKTITATKTAKEGTQVAAALNDANRIYREWKAGVLTNAAADAQLGAHRSLSGIDIAEIDRLVTNRQWNPNELWELTADGQLPAATNLARASTNSIDYTTGINDNILYTDRVGRMYYSNRGDPLKSLETNQPLPTINVFEALTRSTSAAIRTGAWNKYRIEAVNSWVETAKQFNAISNVEVLNRSPWEIMKTAVVETADPAVKAKLTEARRQILFNIDPTTPDSHIMDIGRRRIREWIYDPDGMMKRFPNLTDFIENRLIKDPLASLRGITFDRHIGMFGVDQLFVQSNTLMSAASTYGMRAATDTIPWTLALRAADTVRGFKGTREFNNYLNTLARSHNIPVVELKRRMEVMDRTGILRVGGEFADLQQMGNYVESSRVFGAIDKFRTRGRMFFNWAEQNNRLVAFNIAYDMARRQGLDPMSQRGLDFIALKTQDFSFNMTRSQTAAWQRGLPSVFTQFFGYTGRYIDALYGKNFTPMQKAKFVLSNFIIFGAAGIPFGENIREYMGLGIEQTRGVLDTVISAILGEDTAFRSRVSPAQQLEQLTRELMLEGSSAIFSAPAGETFYEMFETFKPYGKIWNLRYAMEHPNPTTTFAKDSLDIVTDFITPWGRWEKAWYIYNVGRIEDRIGRRVLENDVNSNTASAIAAALGIQMEEVYELNRLWSDMRLNSDQEKKLAERIALEQNAAYWAAIDGDDDRYDRAHRRVELLSAALDEDPAQKQRVLKMAQEMWAISGSREWNLKMQEMSRGY